MLDFLFIILIFCEIALVTYLCNKILELREKIKKLNEVILERNESITRTFKKTHEIARKINLVSSFALDKRLVMAKKIISFAITIIKTLILLRILLRY